MINKGDEYEEEEETEYKFGEGAGFLSRRSARGMGCCGFLSFGKRYNPEDEVN